jgi:hypothetical protein
MLSPAAPSNASIAERIPALMTNQFELEPQLERILMSKKLMALAIAVTIGAATMTTGAMAAATHSGGGGHGGGGHASVGGHAGFGGHVGGHGFAAGHGGWRGGHYARGYGHRGYGFDGLYGYGGFCFPTPIGSICP